LLFCNSLRLFIEALSYDTSGHICGLERARGK
jgi:hypothetical protein